MALDHSAELDIISELQCMVKSIHNSLEKRRKALKELLPTIYLQYRKSEACVSVEDFGQLQVQIYTKNSNFVKIYEIIMA